jgi:hypothetical protein
MTEGDLVTFKAMGEMEEALSPFPGAEKTGVFPILRAVRSPSNIGELDMIGKLFCLKKISQSVGSTRAKAEVDVSCHEFIMHRDALASLKQKVEQA